MAEQRSKITSRPLRVLTVLFFCVGVVFVALVTGDEVQQAVARKDPMRNYFPPEMPRYPNARLVSAGDSVVAGMDSRMAHFTTAHDPAKVADYYAGAWRRQGLWVRQQVSHKGGVVAAVDAARGKIYQILISAQGEQTLVFPSVTAVPQKRVASGAAPPVALYPKSQTLLDTESRAGHRRARVLVTTNAGTLAENRAHYKSATSVAGYREDRRKDRKVAIPKKLAETITVYRHRSGHELTLVISALDEEQTRVHFTVVRGR